MAKKTNVIEIDSNLEETELIPVNQINLRDFFIEQKGVDELLAALRKKVFSAGQSVETADDRDIVRSTAYKVARSRTFLDNLGKDVVKKEKQRIAKANETRKKIKEGTEKIQIEYRKPLTDFEQEEERKKAEEKEKLRKKIEDRIKQLREYRCVLPYQEVASMSDEEFDEVLEREKKAEEDRKAEAEKLEKDKKELEKQKAEIREQKLNAIVMSLTSLGFECEDNYFSIKIGETEIGIHMDVLIDLEIEPMKHKINELSERVRLAKEQAEKAESIRNRLKALGFKPVDVADSDGLKEYFKYELEDIDSIVISIEELIDLDSAMLDKSIDHLAEEVELAKEHEALKEKPPEHEPEKAPEVEETKEIKAEASEEFKSDPEAEAYIQLIHRWIDTMRSIALAPPSFDDKHAEMVCIDVSQSFIEFFDKTKNLVVQSLR